MIEGPVRCAPGVLDAIAGHARRDAPRECCGLLIARNGRLESAVPALNLASEPDRRYEIDPRDYVATLKHCRGTATEVVGGYHSHPRSAAVPSPTDLDLAFGEFLYLIVGPVAVSGPVEIRAYRLIDGNFQPVALVPAPEEPQT